MPSESCLGCPHLRETTIERGLAIPVGDYLCEHPTSMNVAETIEDGRHRESGVWFRWVGFLPRRPVWCPLPGAPRLRGQTLRKRRRSR